jgi:hypothetical protein
MRKLLFWPQKTMPPSLVPHLLLLHHWIGELLCFMTLYSISQNGWCRPGCSIFDLRFCRKKLGSIIRWHPDMNRKSKNQRLWVWLWFCILKFFIKSEVCFFSHGCTNFLGVHPWLKNQISDSIFFERSDWLIPCHKNVLVQHLPLRCSRKMQRNALNIVNHPCAACNLAASFFSIPWQATFAADKSNVFCKQEKPIESQQKIAILQNVNLCGGLWRLQRRKQP